MDTSSSLIARIAEAMPGYSRAYRQLAQFIQTHPFQTSSMSIEELALAADVSIATINRFSRSLGFMGYPPFRAEIRRMFDAAFASVEKLRSGLERNASDAEAITESLQTAQSNLLHTRQWLQSESCRQAVDLLVNAKRVYVAGLGVSALHAAFMVDTLDPFCDVREVVGIGGTERALRHLCQMTDDDLLVAITLPRYSRGVLDIAEQGRKAKVKVLALTNAPNSPIVARADCALFAGAEHPVLYSSNSAIVALIEGLGVAVARRVRGSLNNTANLTERILPYLYLEKPLS